MLSLHKFDPEKLRTEETNTNQSKNQTLRKSTLKKPKRLAKKKIDQDQSTILESMRESIDKFADQASMQFVNQTQESIQTFDM